MQPRVRSCGLTFAWTCRTDAHVHVDTDRAGLYTCLGIADGMSIARGWACRYSKRVPLRGGHFEYRHAHTRAMHMPSAMPRHVYRRVYGHVITPGAPDSRQSIVSMWPPWAARYSGVPQRVWIFTWPQIGSISASPTACPFRGYGRDGTQNDRLGEAVILSTGTAIPAQWACHRRCRDSLDVAAVGRQVQRRAAASLDIHLAASVQTCVQACAQTCVQACASTCV